MSTSTMSAEARERGSILRALAAYGSRIHGALGDQHVAISPLGAFLLLAAISPATSGYARAELDRTLGCSAEQARTWLAGLLEAPHPALAMALALWCDASVDNAEVTRWLATLPARTTRGPIPSAAALDAWANEATRGAIDRFPLDLDPRMVLLLASALATAVTWEDPFGVARSSELGQSPWTRTVREVLVRLSSGRRVLARTQAAGLVAADLEFSTEGLLVTSVIADDGIGPASTMAAAHEVSALASSQPSDAAFVSLFDLPLGEGHAWTLTETPIESRVRNERRTSARVAIPAWVAEPATLDLAAEPSWGLAAPIGSILALLPPHPDGYVAGAAQRVRAQFDRLGFSAAAVTAIGVMMGAAGPGHEPQQLFPGHHRHVHVRFSRPFAVVACTRNPHSRVDVAHWSGIPVFTAWVTTPTEPEPSHGVDDEILRC